ncbi:MerR family transcriptional regulator [Teredinibacter haidensis]|uniref:MerR family transcriptional regulator n=1 Tax=Teredinibacter haidensis TaxID=2731755 RepID=UPI00094910DD|nr:MerR family transcriptional regulator [Teredinibacter haidensis]
MLTVTQVANRYGISRSTILYYEKAGLLQPACRSDNGYRWYGESEMEKLKAILSYRSLGLPVQKLSEMVNRNSEAAQEYALREQFMALETEIANLRMQQQAIVQLLNAHEILEDKMITKERWVEIMTAAGLGDEEMRNWHKKFEQMEPDAHQEFLESLQIDEEEIKQIRTWSAG